MRRELRLAFIKLWVNDFLADPVVQQMDTCAVGAFFLMLMHAWFEKPAATLPKDDAVLRTIARLNARITDTAEVRAMKDAMWESVWAQVRPAFKDGGDRWVQKRLQKEHRDAMKEHKKRVEAGRSGGRKKASNATAMLEQCPSSQSHSQSHSQTNTPQAPQGGINGSAARGGRRRRETKAERQERKRQELAERLNLIPSSATRN